jgi:hypothetical protein
MAGLRAYNRTFSYQDALSDLYPDSGFKELNTYELPLGPALLVDIRFYPGAFFSRGLAANIGLVAHFEQGFATKSIYGENTDQEKELETSMQEIRVGLMGRIPLGESEIDLSGEYGIHKFRLNGDEQGTVGTGTVTDNFPLVPDTDYTFIRVGLEGRFRFSEFMVGVHVAPRIVLGVGDLASDAWFPEASGMGFDTGLMLGYGIIPSLDVVVGVDYLRYGFDFNPIPVGAPVVAGGATDEYTSAYLALLFRLGK